MKTIIQKIRHDPDRLAVYAIISVVGFAAYFPILNNTFIGDDYGLSDKASHATFPNLWPWLVVNKVSFRPLANIILLIQNHLFGIEGFPSHLFTVGLHIACAGLLFWILGYLGIQRTTSYLAALLFLLTPVAPEAVTWSVVRFDALVLLFMLLTIALYLGYLKRWRPALFGGAIVASAAAIFSKESALILLGLIPAMDLLCGRQLAAASGKSLGDDLKSRLSGVIVRTLPFLGVFTAYFTIRYFAIGQVFGSYPNVPTIGRPNFTATSQSFWTILSPLNDLEFSRAWTLVFGISTLVLLLASLAAVLLNWRKTSAAVKGVWVFLVLFFLSSLVPVYHKVFMAGEPQNLRDSRYLYVPMLAFIGLIVIGLLEFGWKTRFWRVPVYASLLIAIPISFYCLNVNNRAWERTAVISHDIPLEARQLLPDPPDGARLYFINIPEWSGAYVYINGLPAAVRWAYGREDLEPVKVSPGKYVQIDPGSYVFTYDEASGQMSMVTT